MGAAAVPRQGRFALESPLSASYTTHAGTSNPSSSDLSADEAHLAIRHRLRGLLLAVHPDALAGSSAEEKAANGESLARLNAMLDAAEAEARNFFSVLLCRRATRP